MSLIKKNTSSPFRLKHSSSDSPAKQVSYEFPSTQATHGSNSGVVAAISGIGKIAGQAIKAGRAGEDLAQAEDLEANINETSKQERKIVKSGDGFGNKKKRKPVKIEDIDVYDESDVEFDDLISGY
jgi:hypothetical protein